MCTFTLLELFKVNSTNSNKLYKNRSKHFKVFKLCLHKTSSGKQKMFKQKFILLKKVKYLWYDYKMTVYQKMENSNPSIQVSP